MEALRQRFRERAARDLDLLRRCLAADDPGAAAVETTAHKLAGSAAIFGFPQVGEAARAVDEAFAAGSRPDRASLEGLIARLAALTSAGAGAEPDSPETPVRGAETILIVEDDELLRANAERALRGQGYQVICAADGDEALARLEALPPFQLLFTDLTLPGAVGGEALAREILRLRPDVRVLFTSGRAAEAGMGHFIAKPWRRDALAARVREVLDSPRVETGPGGP
ncbi:MAG TPA: response regulator [Brevundimonas sp.]|nr:response regulator [Brevundimonas sp.]